MTSAAESANRSAKQAATSRPVKIAARVGILAYGVTHLLIGLLALQVAFGQGGQANESGAFQALAQQPFGQVVLWVLALGFVAAAVWRAELAIWGYSYVSDRKKYLRKKVVSGVKVVIFLVLAVLAGTTAAGGGGGGGGGQQQATSDLFGLPGGQFIVGLIGLVLLVVGGVKVYEGYQKKFLEDMDAPSDRHARTVLERVGQVGNVAKGVSIALIGVLVVVAAARFKPEEATGLDAALKGLAAQPYGPYLLMVVAVGLAAYGVFLFIDSRYHRV